MHKKKKVHSEADAAAAFPYIQFHFQLHPFSISAPRKSGSAQPMGGARAKERR